MTTSYGVKKTGKQLPFGKNSPITYVINNFDSQFSSEIIFNGGAYYDQYKKQCDDLVVNGFGATQTKDEVRFRKDSRDKFEKCFRIYANRVNREIISLDFFEKYPLPGGGYCLYLSGTVVKQEYQNQGISCATPLEDPTLYEGVRVVSMLTQNHFMLKAFMNRFAPNQLVLPVHKHYSQHPFSQDLIEHILINNPDFSMLSSADIVKANGLLEKVYGKQLGVQKHRLPDDVFSPLVPDLDFNRKQGDGVLVCAFIGGDQ